MSLRVNPFLFFAMTTLRGISPIISTARYFNDKAPFRQQCTRIIPKSKIRHHTNPFTVSHQKIIQLSNSWIAESFVNPELPVVIDIGCSKGAWAMNMAKKYPSHNFLGIDIREGAVQLALYRKEERSLNNCHFLFTNANVNLTRILKDIAQAGIFVDTLAIQFPDPMYKTRHQKRRMLNTQLIEDILSQVGGSRNAGDGSESITACGNDVSRSLYSNVVRPHKRTRLFVQTDVMKEMHAMLLFLTPFIEDQRIEPVTGYQYDAVAMPTQWTSSNANCMSQCTTSTNTPMLAKVWMAHEDNANPFTVETERHIETIAKRLPIYRMLFDIM